MNGLILKTGGVAVLLGGFYLYTSYDEAVNYQEVTARVTKVEELCYMKKVERGLKTKTTSTTKEGPCEIVEAIHKGHPEFEGFDLIRVTYVDFAYRAPLDGNTYAGRHKQARHENGQPISEGDSLPILVHKKDPEKTQRS